jgi:capsular polysaccharide biosynthesis protein
VSASTAWDEGPSVLASVWRYRWLLPVALLLGGLVGYRLAALQPTLYEGVSRVFVANPANAGQDGSATALGAARNVANQAAFMASTPVLQRAARRYGNGMTVVKLRKVLTVEASNNSDVITIKALAPTASGAAKLADAVALAYNDVIAENARRQAQVTIRRIQAEKARLIARLSRLNAARALNPNDPSLAAEVDAVNAELRAAINRELQVDRGIGESSEASGLRESATVPQEPVRPKRLQLAAVGALLLLAATVAMAWWRTWRRRMALAAAEPVAPPADPAMLAANGTQPAAALKPVSNGSRGGVGRFLPPGLTSPDQSIPAGSTNPSADRRVTDGPGLVPASTVGQANGGRSGGRPAPEVVQASAMTLTPESILEFQQLASSIQDIADRIGKYRLDLYDQHLPQVEADELADRFDLDLGAILLDDGQGRLKVAGAIGLTEAELRCEIDRDDVAELIGARGHVVLDAERTRLRELGCPGVNAGTLVMVPVGHGARYGVLLAGVEHGAGRDRSALNDQDVEEIAVFTRVITPSLGVWVLLRHLRRQLQDVD